MKHKEKRMIQDYFLSTMKLLLEADEDSKKLLSDIFEPRDVAVPPDDAWRSLLVTRQGYIRCYGEYYSNKTDQNGRVCYIESRDAGLSWRTRFPSNKNALGASAYVPFLDKYCAMRSVEGKGTFFYTADSPDDTPEEIFVCTTEFIDFRLPIPLRSKNRIIVIAHERRPEEHPTCFFALLLISDDGGKTFKIVRLQGAPYYERASENEGVRWQQNNRENTIEELSDGTLLMFSRTATNFHYTTRSHDCGDTWEENRPSVFHSTGTMPLLKRLSDGRILFFWCNTQLLPELPEADGLWEDVFTNRDASHCAISEDEGKSWLGFREFRLNELRNYPDFRSIGGILPNLLDKSVHQFEALELPLGKVLVVSGQGFMLRRVTIFDVRWLYEKSREEDFLGGMQNISCQVYLKSVLGGYRGAGYAGHCAYNRLPGAAMLPNPVKKWREALYLTSLNDRRLIGREAGAVWNFPAATRGEVCVRARITGQALRVTLLDRWLNPCDPTLKNDSASFIFGSAATGDFYDYAISFDTAKGVAECVVNGKTIVKKLPAFPVGVSYVHLQIVSDDENDGAEGAYISHLAFQAK